MICLVALVVFGAFGLFSAKYRTIAKEAFSCVFRRITLRPCETGFDQKMKMNLVGKLSTRSKRAASFVYRRFELISWVFTIIMIASLVLTVSSLYNIAAYGTCDPVSPDGSGGGGCFLPSDTCTNCEICDCEPCLGEDCECEHGNYLRASIG